MTALKLYSKPKPDKIWIPSLITFNTEKASMPAISERLKHIFNRKCILVSSNCTPGYESVKK
jgi:hypothetical protein